jgi:hypothetical protein
LDNSVITCNSGSISRSHSFKRKEGAASMKRAIILSAAVILIVLIGLVALITYPSLNKNSDSKQFYVGVTFGGNTATDAKQLIDRVKNYTNLFVVQSDPLQKNVSALEETCDYAVKSGLDVIVYFGFSSPVPSNTSATFIDTAQARYGSQFLGVYYGDEPGGKMLDAGQIHLYPTGSISNGSITKYEDGSIAVGETYSSQSNVTGTVSTTFSTSGEIVVQASTILSISQNSIHQILKIIDYQPNGTIAYRLYNGTETYGPFTYQPDGTVQDENGTAVTDQGNISQFEPYQQLLDSNPLQSPTKVADAFVKSQHSILAPVKNQSCQLFTSDYALYWWDYQSGYDVVFGELGSNNTAAQEIGLVRGAANLQDKSWGTIITWTYTQPPYLTSGDDMYNEMRLSYECGAKYVIVFNYAPDMSGPYGTLQDEHFQALERFWNEVVQNSSVVQGGIKAEAALVLPKDFGWGMRNPTDTIWGLWNTNITSQQVWTQLQSKLAQYDSKLDIFYDDPAYPAAGKYSQIYYWNQTS